VAKFELRHAETIRVIVNKRQEVLSLGRVGQFAPISLRPVVSKMATPRESAGRANRRTYFAFNSELISPASVTPSICPSSTASGKAQNGESGSNGPGSCVMLQSVFAQISSNILSQNQRIVALLCR
jgi:hypothetical protein